MHTINTSTDPEGWARALDEHLRDMDTFADHVYGHCARTEPLSDEVVRKLAGLLSVGRLADARAFGVPELLHIVMVETPDVAMAARAVLREKYLQAQSAAVADIAWRAQDAERECIDIENELVRGDIGCEWDEVRS